MRKLLPLLFFIVVGCNHCPRFFDCSTCDKEASGDCPSDAADCRPARGRKVVCQTEVPCPKAVCETKRASQPCDQGPEIEIRAPKPIHVKLPPQKIIVQNEMQPHAMPIAQQQAMMQPHSFAPQSFAPQSFAPQSFAPQSMMVPQQMMMMPAMQPQSAGPAGAARPGLTWDVFRLPIPFPRLIAVPNAAPQMQAVAVMAPQSFAPQSFAPQSFAPQSFVAPQQSFAPQSFVPQAAAPQQHMMMSVPGTVDVPVQTMVKVPYQAQVPVPVQPHSFAPQSLGVQPHSFVPQSVAVQPQGMIPVSPQARTFQPQSAQPQIQGISLQQAEEFCRLVEQMKKQMNERK